MSRTEAGETKQLVPRKPKTRTAPSYKPEEVQLPSGAKFLALTRDEAKLIRAKIHDYAADFELTNVSDIADVDTVIQQEMLIQRWQFWLSAKRDYDNVPIDPGEIQKAVKDTTSSLLSAKKQLGIDKSTRDKTEGEGSTAQFIDDLLSRAKEFGVNRNEMSAKAIELAMELIHLVGLYDRSTPEERTSVTIDIDGILEWVRTVFEPEFMAIDEHFRTNKQSMWIRDQ